MMKQFLLPENICMRSSLRPRIHRDAGFMTFWSTTRPFLNTRFFMVHFFSTHNSCSQFRCIFCRSQRIVHFAGAWQNSAVNTMYMAPEDYANALQNSVFCLCPKV